MKFIETADKKSGEKIKLSYEDIGSGVPVILIHGWPLSKEMWEYQIESLLNAGLRVITYDRRGFGKSSKPWTGYDYDSLADDLKAIIDGLYLSNVTLVGFSMGGGEVGRYFSRHNGEKISKVVLVSSILPYMLKTDTNPEGTSEEVFTQMMDNLKKDRIGFLDEFGKTFFGISLLNHPLSAPLLNYYLMLASGALPKATQDCLAYFGFTDFRTDTAKIDVPTLIIHGSADKTVPIAASAEQATKLIPNNTFVVYDGAPHGLFYTEKDRLNNDLISFIIEGKVETRQAKSYYEDSFILPSNEGLVTR